MNFEKSGLAGFAIDLRGGNYLDILARRTFDCFFVGGAGVRFEADIRSSFKESGRARLAPGLASGAAGYFGEFSRPTLGMGDAPTIGTTYWQQKK